MGNATPRLLCLHSFRTSGPILKDQMFQFSNFGEKLEHAGYDLEFLNAPYQCNEEDEKKVYAVVKQAFTRHKKYYEWYNASDDKTEYRRLDETIAYLERMLEQKGPFDGLVGFSQGGSLAHLMAYLQATGQAFTRHPPFKFIVILSSRRSRATIHQPLWQAPPPKNLPKAIVFYGGKDKACPVEDAKKLIETLPGAEEVYLPESDHRVPTLPEAEGGRLLDFLRQ
eukprot:CAMPEP_0115449414 /NCGR_PEP_ID=MMETSP0271-20121206/41000_1 /TAXON_ID=71861 /ORGANISM="Scrippsiella trochoidea, Strain CCMP3099" /LENGTH=224 /DNA_ID=CAMNT_0002875577 /DNA_START=33 /DNA_END=704 /DNA_ORIENTATION=-